MIEPSAQGAWRQLEGRLRPFVSKRLTNPADVDDVVQDIFLRVQQGLPKLRQEQRLGPWVYRVARSAIVDHHRSASKLRLVSHADFASTAEPEVSEEDTDDCVAQELSEYIAPFVAMLPSPYREALTLTELQGMSQPQAAEMLGISVTAMKSRVQRGRAKLRQALLDCCHIALDVRGRVVECTPREDGKLPDGCCG